MTARPATTEETDARPQVRYWIPEGYVTEEGLRADVRSALRPGTNDLVVRVFANLSNRLDKDASQRYGLFGRPMLLTK